MEQESENQFATELAMEISSFVIANEPRIVDELLDVYLWVVLRQVVCPELVARRADLILAKAHAYDGYVEGVNGLVNEIARRLE